MLEANEWHGDGLVRMDGVAGRSETVERGPVVRGLVNLVDHAAEARARSADALASASVRSPPFLSVSAMRVRAPTTSRNCMPTLNGS